MIYLYPKVAWYSYTLGKLTVVIKPSVKYVAEMLDCKTVGFFFSKSVKKSVKRGVRVLRARSLIADLLFDCSRVLEYAKIRTVLQSTEMSE